MFERREITSLTFPYHADMPAERLQAGSIASVAFHISTELVLPEGVIAAWRDREATSGMLMPETATDVNDGAEAPKHNVRATGQPPIVQPVAKTSGMEESAYEHLRLGVLAPDAGHHPASCCTINDIRHRRYAT